MPMTRVAIAGLGAIGREVARRLSRGMPGFMLACAAARDRAKAQAWLDAERITCPLVDPEAFPAHADLAIDCTPSRMLEQVCRPMLELALAWPTSQTPPPLAATNMRRPERADIIAWSALPRTPPAKPSDQPDP